MTTDIGPISYIRSYFLGDDPTDPGVLPPSPLVGQDIDTSSSTDLLVGQDAGLNNQTPPTPSVEDLIQKTHANLPLAPKPGAALVIEIDDATPRALTRDLPEIDRTRLTVPSPVGPPPASAN